MKIIIENVVRPVISCMLLKYTKDITHLVPHSTTDLAVVLFAPLSLFHYELCPKQ